jgi:hypothetical protein
MNRKQLLILIVLVVVLGGAGLLLHKKEASSFTANENSGMGQKLLGTFPVNDVAHIEIKQGTNDLNLAKKDNLWRVRERNDYPANYSQIAEFLLKAQDLKVVQSEAVGPSQLPRLWLVAGSGTNSALVVDLKDKSDKTIKSLLLGKKHMKKSDRPSPYGDMDNEGWPDGRYVKVGDSANVAVISDALSNIEPKPDQWLNKDFFHVEKVKGISATFPNPTNSWKVSRDTETAEWKLADAKPNEQLDSTKTSSLSNPLSSPTFNDVATSATPEQLGLDKPTVLTLDTFENFTYTLKVGQKTNDIYAMTVAVAADIPKERTPGKDEKAEDKDKLDKAFKENQKKLQDKLDQEKSYDKWIYLVSSWTLDSVVKERSQLLKEEKKEEPKKDQAKKDDAKADSNDILSAPLPGASGDGGASTATPK